MVIIFDLAIIIRAATKILKMISEEDMVSNDENDVIDMFVKLFCMINAKDLSARSNIIIVVIHQYILALMMSAIIIIGRTNFNI